MELTLSALKNMNLFHDIIIASSSDGNVSLLNAVCGRYGAKQYVGDNDSPGLRIRNALLMHGCHDGVAVRVNAENIFIMPYFVKELLESHRKSGADYSYFSDAPNGLAPDIVSVTALLESEQGNEPYYRVARKDDSPFTVNKISLNIDMEYVSFTALEPEGRDLYGRFSGRLSELNLWQFLEEAREIYREFLENDSYPPKRMINYKLNAIEKALRLDKLYSMPTYLRVGVSDMCNLKCATCIQQYSSFTQEEFNSTLGNDYNFWDMTFEKRNNGGYHKKSEFLTPERFNKIKDIFFPYARHCGFGLFGEPLLNRNLPVFISEAKKLGLDTSMISNGLALEKKISEKLADGILDQISISFDGATKGTFEMVRKGSDFDKIKQNIKTLARLRDAAGSKLSIWFATTISTLNFRELPDIVKVAEEIGVDTIGIRYTTTTTFMNRDESLYNRLDEVATVFEKTRRQAIESGINLSLPHYDINGSRHRSMCRFPWEQIFVLLDGRVIVCCLISHKESIDEKVFSDIWNGDFFRKLRRSNAGKEPMFDNCINCSEEILRDVTNSNSFFISKNSHPF